MQRGARAVAAPAALIELGLLAGAIALAWSLVPVATGRYLARVAELAPAVAPAPGAVELSARAACLAFTGGVLALAIGRAIGLGRAAARPRAPLLLPAVAFAALLGLVLHAATVESFYRATGSARALVVLAPGAASFATGVLFGGLLGGALLALPGDPGELARRAQVPLLVAILAVFVALALVGSGPGESGTRINLGPMQPIEAVKPAFVAFLAAYLGRRAGKLRWQRARLAGLRWPRPALLVPALAGLIALFAGLFLVRDLGPTLILSIVFLALFYLATRASGWALAAAATVAALLVLFAWRPELAGGGSVTTRLAMWSDPWQNALSHGHQLGEALWAIAAGGGTGQGLAQAHTPLVPTGTTDLALATLIEQLGLAGLALYLLLLGAIVMSGLRVAAHDRTPERVLLAAGLSLLILVQWGIIHAGTTGLLPLTGVVVPYLSSGKSSMVVFIAIAALLARLGMDARERARSAELDELRAGVLPLARAAAAALAVGLASAAWYAVIDRDEVAARGIAVRLADGTAVIRLNPRLVAIARAIHRGAILDRDGRPLAHSPDRARPHERETPLGDALGTLLGAHPARVKLPWWALEARWDERLRGYGERTDGPRYADLDAGPSTARLPYPDLRRYAPLLALSPEERAATIAAIDADLASRSVRLSLDARLQADTAKILAGAARAARAPAAAAAVIDVDSGQVLARAQVPDLDPSDRSWQKRLAAGDARFAATFYGPYGAGADKTGLLGVYQAGSVGKLFTALAAARAGWRVIGEGCATRSAARFSCSERDRDGPLFTLPGWPQPVHDHPEDPVHGELDAVGALAVSCNVFFAQLGLELGPEPLADLRRAGVEVGFAGDRIPFEPGAPGSRQLASTAFGQGAMAMNVVQAARLAAAIGAGGRYRRCPATLELDGACEEIAVVGDARAVAPILAGMRRVMTAGTGARLARIPGVRMYGKTGTADATRFRGEELYGVPASGRLRPHSWFVAIAEPADTPECAPASPGRLAIAVVVPRAGAGSRHAGPAAVEIARAAARHGLLGAAAQAAQDAAREEASGDP